VTSSRDTVTRSDAVTGNAQQEFTQSDLQKRVAEKQADSLRLLIVVGGHGAFVPRFAIARRSSSLTSIVNRRHGALSLHREDSARKTVPNV
jgi:hypothetical protein